MNEEEVYYDPLSQTQKHIMLKNGTFEFEFDSIKQSSYCCCGHAISEHLDCVDCCLNKELCICDRFLDGGSKVTIPQKQRQKQGKLPHKELLQKQKEQIEDKQLGNYIQSIARM
jgi:hypothetical protein